MSIFKQQRDVIRFRR